MSVWSVLLAFAIVARTTRFINADKLAGRFRAWVMRRSGLDGFWTTLVFCSWCVSVWVAAPVAPVAYLWGDTWWFTIVGLWLGLSYGVAALSGRLDPPGRADSPGGADSSDESR